MNGCQFGFGSSALRGKIESGGGLSASLPVETRARWSTLPTKLQLAPMQRCIHGKGTEQILALQASQAEAGWKQTDKTEFGV